MNQQYLFHPPPHNSTRRKWGDNGLIPNPVHAAISVNIPNFIAFSLPTVYSAIIRPERHPIRVPLAVLYNVLVRTFQEFA